MATIVLDPGETFEHWHSDGSVTELRSGSVRCRFDGKLVTLSPGEQLEIPAGVTHTLENVGSTPACIGCVHYPRPGPKKPMPMPKPKPVHRSP